MRKNIFAQYRRNSQPSRILWVLAIALTTDTATGFGKGFLWPNASLDRYGSVAFAQSIDARPPKAETLLTECEDNVQRKIPDPPYVAYWVDRADDYAASLSPCQEALEIYRASHALSGEAKVLSLLGVAYSHILENLSQSFETEERMTAFEQAVAVLQAALGIYQALGNQSQEAATLYRLGYVHREVRQYETGLENLQQALTLYQVVDNPILEAATRHQLGLVYRGLEQYETAIASFEQVIAMAQSSNNLSQGAAAFYQLGFTHRVFNQDEQALAALENYITLTRESAGPLATAKALRRLGSIYSAEQRRNLLDVVPPAPLTNDPYEQGLDFYQRALAIYRSLDNIAMQAETLAAIGSAHYRQQRYDKAFQVHMQALDVASKIEDRKLQAEVLRRSLGQDLAKYQIRHTEKAIQLEQRELEIYRANGDRPREAGSLATLGHIYFLAEHYKEGLESFQQALAIYQALGDRQGQASVFFWLGERYLQAGQNPVISHWEQSRRSEQYQQALQFFQQSIALYVALAEAETDPEQQRKQRLELADRLTKLGSEYPGLGGSREVGIQFEKQALAIYRQLDQRGKEAGLLFTIGNSLLFQANETRLAGNELQASAQYQQALEIHQEALDLYQKLGGTDGVFRGRLSELSLIYVQTEQYEQAIKFSQAITQISGNRKQEASILSLIGNRFSSARAYGRFPEAKSPEHRLGLAASKPLTPEDIAEYHKALEFQQRALEIYRQLGEGSSARSVLIDIGDTYVHLQKLDRALALYHHVLHRVREAGDLLEEVRWINDRSYGETLSTRYLHLGQHEQLFELYDRALAIYRELNQPGNESLIFFSMGLAHQHLEQYEPAQIAFEQSLQLSQTLEDTNWQRITLKHMGEAALASQQYDQARDYFERAIALRRQTGNRHVEMRDLKNIGTTYLKAGQVESAVEFHERSLDLIRAESSYLKEIEALNRLGEHYAWYEQHGQALVFYQRALALSNELQQEPDFDSLDWTGTILGNMGAALQAQDHLELAIVFYKAAVNSYEKIRTDYTEVTAIPRRSFTDLLLIKHQDDYRTLADLLLQQDRILEAQQVLDRLKIQELDDYLQNVRSETETVHEVDVLRPEKNILSRYNQRHASAIELGKELRGLEQILVSERTDKQQQRYAQLVQLEQDINTQFNDFIDSDEIQDLVAQLTRTAKRQNPNLEDFVGLSDNLREYNGALLYPLILDDRLELIITTPDSPPLRRTMAVPKAKLNKMVQIFREQLTTRDPNVKQSAQNLYRWLIQPLEADLAQANITTIIYAPDGVLRYIPLAALHDGQQWLAERYQVNHITARSLIDFNHPRSDALSALAGAFQTGSVELRVGDRNIMFQGLPYAGKEVEDLVAILPGSVKLLDQDFSPAGVIPHLKQHAIIHFATHAEFITGEPEESFILFGNGDRMTLSEIKNWRIPDVDLVVLSACETGVGGLGNGVEILGLGYQFQRAGAKAAIASLWKVDDGGTQVLMTEFYTALHQQGLSKAEALQRAQQAMIQEDATVKATHQQMGGIEPAVPSASQKTSLSHPYYWAPFILIGNGF